MHGKIQGQDSSRMVEFKIRGSIGTGAAEYLKSSTGIKVKGTWAQSKQDCIY